MTDINHLAIIMDGNRRWARQRGLPTFSGHYRGYEKVLALTGWAIKAKIKIISVYAFSSENWSRSKHEVGYLMKLAKLVFKKHQQEFNDKGVKILVSGLREGLDQDLIKLIEQTEKTTKNNKKLILNICFNYGGRQEIVAAVKKIIKNKISANKLNTESFRQYLFHDLPDPEIIVRTSGEQRLSNFLTWQSVYAELVFLKKHWPDFSEKDLKQIINIYKKRQRRFGQ